MNATTSRRNQEQGLVGLPLINGILTAIMSANGRGLSGPAAISAAMRPVAGISRNPSGQPSFDFAAVIGSPRPEPR